MLEGRSGEFLFLSRKCEYIFNIVCPNNFFSACNISYKSLDVTFIQYGRGCTALQRVLSATNWGRGSSVLQGVVDVLVIIITIERLSSILVMFLQSHSMYFQNLNGTWKLKVCIEWMDFDILKFF